MKKYFLLFLYYLLIFFFYQLFPTSAQETESILGVTPAVIEEVVNPGYTKTFKVIVYNLSTSPLPIQSSSKNLANASSVLDASSWINVKPSNFILNPQEKKEVEIKIKVPQKVSPGGHYSTVYFQPLIQERNNTSNINLTPQVGVVVFFIVKGNIVKNAALGSVFYPRFLQSGYINFQIPITNTGNVHFMPDGYISFYNFRNKLIDKAPLPATIILPETSKIISVNYLPSKKIAIYKAKLNFTISSDKPPINYEFKWIWKVPLFYILVFCLLTLIVIYLTINKNKFKLAIKILFNRP